MEATRTVYEELIGSAARQLTGHKRRRFIGEVTQKICDGNARLSESRFGWGRETARTGMAELNSGIRCLENFQTRGRQRSEEKNPQLAADIRAIVEPWTQADPELKSTRRYMNLTAAEVRQALVDQKGYDVADLPAERTMRDILNRMNYRLKRIQKGKPLKKTEDTDAIFANVQTAKREARSDDETLEISVDTKAKVALGEYSRGGKNPDRLPR